MKKIDFKKYYKNVPPEQSEKLMSFRLSHKAKKIDVDGKHWTYIASGKGNKTLMFLPGAFLKADMWFYSISELEKDFRIIAPDTNTLFGISAGQALKTIPYMIDTEGVKKVNLIGLSAGGGLAQILLSKYPELVEDIVLSHTGIIEQVPGMEKKTRRFIRLAKMLPLFIIHKFILGMTSGHIPETSKWKNFHDAYFKEGLTEVTRQAVLSFLENGIVLRREFGSKLNIPESWKGRVLILNSKDDTVTLPKMEKLKQRYPNAETHVFEEGGHHTFMLYPELYTSVLKAFFANNGNE